MEFAVRSHGTAMAVDRRQVVSAQLRGIAGFRQRQISAPTPTQHRWVGCKGLRAPPEAQSTRKPRMVAHWSGQIDACTATLSPIGRLRAPRKADATAASFALLHIASISDEPAKPVGTCTMPKFHAYAGTCTMPYFMQLSHESAPVIRRGRQLQP
jgi:hypothetical protein